MRIVIQRVKSGAVTVDGTAVGSIGSGLVCYVGISRDDTPDDLEHMFVVAALSLGQSCNEADFFVSVWLLGGAS